MNDIQSLEEEIDRLLQHVISALHLDLQYILRAYPGQSPAIRIDLHGPDAVLLLKADGELLKAIEYLLAAIYVPEHPERLACRLAAAQPPG